MARTVGSVRDEEYNERLFTWLRDGTTLSVRIDRRYPLSEVRAAHAAVEQRRTAGRVLLLRTG